MFFVDKKFLVFFFKRVKINTSGRYESEFPYVSPCGRETNYICCDDLPVVFSQLLDSEGQVIQDIGSFGSSLPDHNPPNYHGGYPPNEASESVKGKRNPSAASEKSGVWTPLTIQTERTEEARPLMDLKSTTATNGSVGSESGLYSPLSTSLRLAYGGTHSLTVPFQPSSLCMLPASGRVYHSGLEKLGGVGLIKSSLAMELSRFFVYGEEEGREEEGVREGANPVGFRWQRRTWPLDSALMLPRVAQFTNAQT